MTKERVSHEEQLIWRITECNEVINEIDNSKLWGIILKDTKALQDNLDSNWQSITDADSLLKARVAKLATQQILTTKERYMEELKQQQRELDILQNPDKKMLRDYDAE